jgi:polar amino acid transport system permease protein
MIRFNFGKIQKTPLRWDLMTESAVDVARAFLVNLKLAVIAQVLVMIFGLFLAVARLTPDKAGAPIRFVATAYSVLFRAVPANIALTLTYSAHIAET